MAHVGEVHRDVQWAPSVGQVHDIDDGTSDLVRIDGIRLHAFVPFLDQSYQVLGRTSGIFQCSRLV